MTQTPQPSASGCLTSDCLTGDASERTRRGRAGPRRQWGLRRRRTAEPHPNHGDLNLRDRSSVWGLGHVAAGGRGASHPRLDRHQQRRRALARRGRPGAVPAGNRRRDAEHQRPRVGGPGAKSVPGVSQTRTVASDRDSSTGHAEHRLNDNLVQGEPTIVCTTDSQYFNNPEQAVDLWNGSA